MAGEGYKIATGYIQIMPEMKDFTSSLKGSMDSEGEAAGGRFGGAFSKGMKAAGAAVAAASAAVGAFATKAVQAGMGFDSAMSQVAATMGTTVDQITELRDFAQEMGATTAFSATQAAEALNYMALAGYDAETSMAMLPNVLNLAAAGGIDLAYASDMVTDASSALGLSIDETSTMVDQMAAAASNSNTSVSQLGEAILTIGATARNVKGGTQELSTVLGVLADNGIKGSEGGTHLRNILLSLQNPTSEAAKLLDHLGVEVYDTEGNMRSLTDIVGDLSDGIDGFSQEDRDSVISRIFNKTDLASVNALLGTSKERFDELSVAIENSAGAAQTMADVQLDNLEGDVTLFKSALEGAEIAISDALTPTLREFVQFGTNALTDMTKAFKEDGLGGAINVLGDYLSKGVDMVVDALPDFVAAGTTLLVKLAAAMVTNIPDIITGIVTGLIDGISMAITGHATGWFGVAELYAKDLEEIAGNISTLRAQIDETNASYDSAVEASAANAAAATVLKDEILTLVDAEDKTAGQKALIKTLVGELNELVPDLALAYDEETDSLNLTNDEIERNIELVQRQAEINALTELYTETLKEQFLAQKNVQDAYSELELVLDGYGLTMEDMNKITADGKIVTGELWEYIWAGKIPITEIFSSAETLTEAWNTYAYATIDAAETTDTLNYASAGLEEAMENMAAGTELTLSELNSAWQTSFGQDMPDALQLAIDASADAGINIPSVLATGIINGSIDVDTAVMDLNGLVEFNDAVNSAVQAGADITAEEAAQLYAGMGSVESAIAALNAVVAFNEAVEKAKSDGINVDEGFIQGLMDASGLSGIYNAADGAGRKAIDGIKSGADVHSPSWSANQAGQNVLAGLYNGLNNGYYRSSIFSSMWSLGASIISRVKSAMGVASPSVYAKEIGQFFDEGLRIGIEDGKEDVLDSAGGMADDVLETVNGVVNELNGAALETAIGGTATINSSLASSMEENIRASIETPVSQENTMAAVIGHLQRAVAMLEIMSKMKMVTDTGVLVGEMAEVMDGALEAIRIRKDRG